MSDHPPQTRTALCSDARTAAIVACSRVMGTVLISPSRLFRQAQVVDVTTLIDEGTDMVPACVTCHGAQGLGDADFGAPMIAGLDAGYIGRVLTGYADGTRVGYTMNGIASALTAAEISALAAHFATLPVSQQDWQIDPPRSRKVRLSFRMASWPPVSPPALLPRSDRGGVGTTFPRLAGQFPDYMTARIELWNTGEDTATPRRSHHGPHCDRHARRCDGCRDCAFRQP